MALASFVSTPVGTLYGRVCEKWGRDPAAFLEPVDDVLAFDFRAALTLAMAAEDAEDEPDEATKHHRLVTRAREASAELRSVTHG
jgi:hypothetical protein